MPSKLLDDLSALTGEDLYHLINMLDRHQIRVVEKVTCQLVKGEDSTKLGGLLLDLMDLRQDALMQIARIPLPLRDAQAIIQRHRFLRRGPVPVNADAEGWSQS